MKFYDLKTEYLVDDKDFAQRFSNKNNMKSETAVIESNIRNYIFSAPIAELEKGSSTTIEVLKSLKVNGENAQISWVREESVW